MAASSAGSGAMVEMAIRPRAREEGLPSVEVIIRRRNDDWLNDFEVGRPDLTTGRFIPRSMALIAALYGVNESTVWRGIKAARELREAIEDVT